MHGNKKYVFDYTIKCGTNRFTCQRKKVEGEINYELKNKERRKVEGRRLKEEKNKNK